MASFNYAVAGGSGQRIVLRRLDTSSTLQSQDSRAGTSAAADRMRTVWRDMLEVHAAHSSPNAAADGTPSVDTIGVHDAASEAAADALVPWWRLQCDKGQQLQQLCLHFTTLCTEYLMKVLCLCLVKHAKSALHVMVCADRVPDNQRDRLTFRMCCNGEVIELTMLLAAE